MLQKLYLDETGHMNANHPSPYFVLSGILIRDEQAARLAIDADRIRFKYWNNMGIVFHSREIGNRVGEFSILRDPNVEASFHKDLQQMLLQRGFKCIIVAVDKKKAFSLGWTPDDIYSTAADEIIQFLLKFLSAKKDTAQIVIESAGSGTDFLFYKQYAHYLSNGMPSIGLTHQKTKQTLTSISFVSKNNDDIETQIADLLAYPAVCRCQDEDGLGQLIPNSYEQKMVEILNSKIATVKSGDGFIRIP